MAMSAVLLTRPLPAATDTMIAIARSDCSFDCSISLSVLSVSVWLCHCSLRVSLCYIDFLLSLADKVYIVLSLWPPK